MSNINRSLKVFGSPADALEARDNSRVRNSMIDLYEIENGWYILTRMAAEYDSLFLCEDGRWRQFRHVEMPEGVKL